MADVEKININSTDYDIADAKALRNKDNVGSGTFVDSRAGTTTYPTPGTNLINSTIIGDKAYISNNNNISSITVVGANARGESSNVTVVGNTSSALSGYSSVYGCQAKADSSASCSVVLGAYAISKNAYNTVVGYGATATAGYNVVVGANALVNAGCNNVTICGRNSNADRNCSSSSVLGANASVTQSQAVQLGQGTNNNYGSLQFRTWPLVNGNGKIYEERLPDGIKTATPRAPNLYDINEEKVSEQAILYTGTTNDSYKNSQFYRGRIREGHPIFNCGYVDTEWLDSQNDVMIDQEKLFTKLAEVTKQRIDNNDVSNGVIGGGNSEQSICLYYDAVNDYYFIRFDSDSFESAFNHAPDDITGLSFDDLADYGIYFRNFHKPSDLDGEYEFCDIYYYALAYIDSYDWNNSPSYVNYFKFLNALYDWDWGAGYVVPSMEYWTFEVDGTTYYCPIIPKTYEYDGSEYDGVEFRWEWNSDDEKWIQYINGKDISRSWSTADLYGIFGIYVEPGEESSVEHIGLTVRGGVQRYWNQFDPVDSANFCTKQEKQDMQGDITRLENKSFKLIQNARDLNTFINSGAYHIQALGCTNLPSTASASRDMFLFVTKTNANNVKQVLITDDVNKSYGSINYGTYCSNMYVRTLSGGNWRSWEVILTPDDLMFLSSFDLTKKQVLVHGANSAGTKWEDYTGSGGGDIDCGTMS